MKLFIFLLVLFSSTILLFAQDASEGGTPNAEKTTEKEVVQEIILTSSPHVSCTYIFPESPNEEFIIGNTVEILLGLSNTGEAPINVTSVSASLRYPTDWRYFIQNFTRQAVSVIVRSGEEATFIYRFVPDPMLEPRDFGISAEVFYHDFEGGNFTSSFFNDTVKLVESSESIDLQTLFTYIGIVGVAGLVLFIIYKAVSDKKGKRISKLETGTQKDVVDDEWLEGTHAMKNAKAPRSPTKSRKAKNQ